MNNNPLDALHPRLTDWPGYNDAFQSALNWLLASTRPDDEEGRASMRRSRALSEGEGLAPHEPDLVPGSGPIVRAFDMADFAAKEWFMRSRRRAGLVLPSIHEISDRLSNSPVDFEKKAGQLLMAMWKDRSPGSDPLQHVVDEITKVRGLTPRQRMEYVRANFLRSGFPGPDLKLLQHGEDETERFDYELMSLLNCIESHARSYR